MQTTPKAQDSHTNLQYVCECFTLSDGTGQQLRGSFSSLSCAAAAAAQNMQRLVQPVLLLLLYVAAAAAASAVVGGMACATVSCLLLQG
jgi:hypothetical protein